MEDIIIIGSGIIGCSVARELSRYDAKILVLEKENDISMGTTKANSGIVHAGFDANVGSLKAKFNVLGNQMFDGISKQLDFPFKRNGAYVVCFDEPAKAVLEELLDKGIKNGVRGLKIISGDEARKSEIHLSKEVKYALYAPTSGIVSPYEMAIGYAENASMNGVNFKFNCEVTNIYKDGEKFVIEFANGEKHEAKVVINCAGVYADKINNMISDKKFSIIARKGEYCLLDKNYGYYTDKTIFQTPNKMGKGVLVAKTTHGNIIVGPNAHDVSDKEALETSFEGLNEVWNKALLSINDLNKRAIITQFAGLRAHCESDDFIIGFSDVDGFYNVAAIESPGLSSAPAIALKVAIDVQEKLNLLVNKNFNPNRKGIPHFSSLSDAEKEKIINENPLYGHVICRCEVVTEGEIVDSIRRPLGAKDLDGVKRRTRAGMGRCQMGFCTPKIMEILAEELNVDITEITKKGKNSHVVTGRINDDK